MTHDDVYTLYIKIIIFKDSGHLYIVIKDLLVFTEAVWESRMVTIGFTVTNYVIRITSYPVNDLESL
jgi:hypothetical protein